MDAGHKSAFFGACLHVGCGGSPLPAWLTCDKEIRLDIDEQHCPDLVGDMRNVVGVVGNQRFGAVFSNHSLEHLYPHEIVPTLEGFREVLHIGGAAVVIVPNLEGIAPTDDVVYESPCGPISGHDMYYGHHKLIADMPFMAHHSGFTKSTLEKAFKSAGFEKVCVKADDGHNLIAVGIA